MTRLRRSDCHGPGIRRRRRGKGFSYVADDGAPLRDAAQLARIRSLAIPPAWTDVWICPWPNGHIQALGTDAAGRRQYRYHDAWREQRDKEKFDRVLELGRRLPEFRPVVDRHLAMDGMPRERALAAAARLLDVASLRVGGEEYAEDNETYGIATLERRHARVSGDHVSFCFTAKAGQEIELGVEDAAVADVVRAMKRRRGGGDELLAWRSGRRWVDVRSGDINDYVKEFLGEQFSAKDFRTWNATVLACVRFAALSTGTVTSHKRAVTAVVKVVAEHLGNTPAVCRKSYVDPRAIELFHRDETIPATLLGPSVRRERVEKAVVALLGGPATSRRRGGAGTARTEALPAAA